MGIPSVEVQADARNWDVSYHYTSAASALNILDQEELWASSILGMNDGVEFRYAADLFRSYVSRDDLLLDGDRLSAQTLDITLSLVDELLAGDVFVFAVCASRQPSDLSQWRAYASERGGGVALHIDLRHSLRPLGKIGRMAQLGWRDVTYVDALAYPKFDSLLRMIRDNLDAPFLSNWVAQTFTPAFALIKSPEFAIEQEVRALCAITPEPELRPEPRYRMGRFGVTSYFPMTFREHTEDGPNPFYDAVCGLTVGPAPGDVAELNYRFLKERLRGKCPVYRSSDIHRM